MQNLDLERDKRVVVVATGYGIITQESLEVIERFTEVAKIAIIEFSELISPLVDAFGNMKQFLDELNIDEIQSESKREIYKLDFRRPKIQHQVLDRKPRNLIKKNNMKREV